MQEVLGKVRNVEPFGVFISIANSALKGLAHISELSDDFVKDPGSKFSPGQTVRAVVLGTDVDKGRVSLGLKRSYFVADQGGSDSDGDAQALDATDGDNEAGAQGADTADPRHGGGAELDLEEALNAAFEESDSEDSASEPEASGSEGETTAAPGSHAGAAAQQQGEAAMEASDAAGSDASDSSDDEGEALLQLAHKRKRPAALAAEDAEHNAAAGGGGTAVAAQPSSSSSDDDAAPAKGTHRAAAAEAEHSGQAAAVQQPAAAQAAGGAATHAHGCADASCCNWLGSQLMLVAWLLCSANAAFEQSRCVATCRQGSLQHHAKPHKAQCSYAACVLLCTLMCSVLAPCCLAQAHVT